MEELLPFLLGIIFLAVRYYNKTQKDKNNTRPITSEAENQEQSSKKSLDDYINQFMEDKMDVFSPVTSSNTEEQTTSEWMAEMHEEEPESIEYTPKEEKNTKVKSQFETIQNKEPLDTETPDFDLRKAVIYEAVLNPPYL